MDNIISILKTSKWWYWLPFGQYNIHCMNWIFDSETNTEYYIKNAMITLYSVIMNVSSTVFILYFLVRKIYL